MGNLTISGLKNIASCELGPLCLFGIEYWDCERGTGISSDTERDTTRGILLLRGGGGFKIVSLFTGKFYYEIIANKFFR